MRVKVKLVLEDKLKIWSFESENINELTLPSVLEDVYLCKHNINLLRT